MLEYDKIDSSEGLTLIKQINQKNVCFVIIGIFCLDNNFTYGPYLCDGCYNIMWKTIIFKKMLLLMLKSIRRIYFLYMSKREANILMTNSDLIDKKGIL